MHDSLDSLPPSLAAMFRAKAEAARENILHQQRLQHERELAEVRLESERQHAKIRRASAPTTRGTARSSHSRPLKPFAERKRQIIRDLSRMNLEGIEYCAKMDERIAIPQAWVQQGCPKSYVGAYQLPKWRQRINDEKYRMTKK
jgi:hypothetical protein